MPHAHKPDEEAGGGSDLLPSIAVGQRVAGLGAAWLGQAWPGRAG